MASHGFWSLGAQNAGDNNSGSSTPRAWCQAAAQKFGGGIGSKLCALLNVGEMEKGADPSAAKQGEDPLAESCSCSDKPCICSKATVGFSHLYSTDLLPALDGDTKTMNFLQEVVDILLAYIVESFDRSTKVIDFHYPNELLQRNNWELSDEPETLDDILISCRKYIYIYIYIYISSAVDVANVH
uniref:Glutamate decarboxylase 2 n=1 Tax=Astyanax mexicanus TaxID=7994 RepID=A0A3B1IX74_ASTMX